jgi:hypothetical protein
MEIVVIDDMGERVERCQLCHRNPAEFNFKGLRLCKYCAYNFIIKDD